MIWTISPHSIPTHTLSQQLSPTRLNFDALQYEGIRDKMEKSKLDAIQQKLHDLEKKVNGRLNSKLAYDLRYENLCLHPRVKLPSGFKIPKFNMFNGRGDPIAYLKDFCSRLVGLENNEHLLMRLFIQSLSGIALTWYVKQDFDKWLAWEDMAQDFVEQHKFNTKIDPTLTLDGVYYKTLYFVGIQSFDSLIRIGKELEYDIQSGRIVNKQIHFQVLKNPLDEKSRNASTFVPPKQSNQNTEQVHAIFNLCNMHFKPYNSRVSLHKPRKGWIPKHSFSTLDLSKNCEYHSNIQGHDIEECPALRNKIQNMIENGKIIVQQGPLDNNSCNPSTSNTIIVQGDPTWLYSRHLTRKCKSHQRN
ncbi:hypothetical protein H5410_022612 [Solanum commersonii]|uniref:Retrotransposon gag domain-containing protein n=1 Tax=Solanum commersonii TaxID=4109 RepID=A0A9J5ZEJ3_SOLCO|nr:hypothetical protein H5410_022612 [Solanum commersonii]